MQFTSTVVRIYNNIGIFCIAMQINQFRRFCILSIKRGPVRVFKDLYFSLYYSISKHSKMKQNFHSK